MSRKTKTARDELRTGLVKADGQRRCSAMPCTSLPTESITQFLCDFDVQSTKDDTGCPLELSCGGLRSYCPAAHRPERGSSNALRKPPFVVPYPAMALCDHLAYSSTSTLSLCESESFLFRSIADVGCNGLHRLCVKAVGSLATAQSSKKTLETSGWTGYVFTGA